MIIDLMDQLQQLIDKKIESALSVLPISYPCKVQSVESDGVFVTVETLLKKDKLDNPKKIPILQSPYLALPIKQGDIGIALNCSYLFATILDDATIENNIRTTTQNGLFFIPLVSKSKFKGKVNETLLANQDYTAQLKMKQDQSITMESGNTIEIKGVSASLGKILEDIVQMLINANADPVAGNGAPLNSTNISSKAPQILQEIKGNFK